MTISKFASKLTLVRLLGEEVGTFMGFVALERRRVWPVLREHNSTSWGEKGNNNNANGAAFQVQTSHT